MAAKKPNPFAKKGDALDQLSGEVNKQGAAAAKGKPFGGKGAKPFGKK